MLIANHLQLNIKFNNNLQFICNWFDLHLLMFITVWYLLEQSICIFSLFASGLIWSCYPLITVWYLLEHLNYISSLFTAGLIWTCYCLITIWYLFEHRSQFICSWFGLDLLFVGIQTLHLVLNSWVWTQQLASVQNKIMLLTDYLYNFVRLYTITLQVFYTW